MKPDHISRLQPELVTGCYIRAWIYSNKIFRTPFHPISISKCTLGKKVHTRLLINTDIQIGATAFRVDKIWEESLSPPTDFSITDI